MGVLKGSECKQGQAHGNSFCAEVRRFEACLMSYGAVQRTVGVDDKSGSGPDALRY